MEDTERDDRELEFEATLSREEVADHLVAVADSLRRGETFEIDVGGRVAVLDPPEAIDFEVEVEDEAEDEGVERSVEFELEWLRQEGEEPLPGLEDVEE